MDDTRCRQFFSDADSTIYHRQYEALRAVFVEGLPQNDVAARVAVHTPGVNYVHYNSSKDYIGRTCDVLVVVDLSASAANQGISDCRNL
jgi:hypothetical protein